MFIFLGGNYPYFGGKTPYMADVGGKWRNKKKDNKLIFFILYSYFIPFRHFFHFFSFYSTLS